MFWFLKVLTSACTGASRGPHIGPGLLKSTTRLDAVGSLQSLDHFRRPLDLLLNTLAQEAVVQPDLLIPLQQAGNSNELKPKQRHEEGSHGVPHLKKGAVDTQDRSEDCCSPWSPRECKLIAIWAPSCRFWDMMLPS